MEKGHSSKTEMLLRFIPQETKDNMELYINEELNKNYQTISTEEEANELYGATIRTFIENLSEEERMSLRLYTGYDFRCINSMLRGLWDYELNGALTEERKNVYQKLCFEIAEVIKKFPPLITSFKSYRGVDLRPFKEYGISSIAELTSMKDSYYYESAFTSTSLVRSTSFYNQEVEWGTKSNIEIEYYIPEASSDGAMLLSDSLSYSKMQNEYLITSGSLFKIIDVQIDEKNNSANLKAILIPKKVWDPVPEEQVTKNI